jgi:hypothetical protein
MLMDERLAPTSARMASAGIKNAPMRGLLGIDAVARREHHVTEFMG